MAHFLIDVLHRYALTRRITHGVWATDLASALAAEAPPNDDERWTETRTVTAEETMAHRPAEDEWVTVATRLENRACGAMVKTLEDRGIATRVSSDHDGWDLAISRLQLTDAFEAVAAPQPAPTQHIADSYFEDNPRPRADGMETAEMIAPTKPKRPYRVIQKRYVPLDSPHHGGEHATQIVLIDPETGRDGWGAWGIGTLREEAEAEAYRNAVALSEAAPDDMPDIG